MESLRGSAVARVIQALNKKGRLYTAELSYETRVSPRHLSTVVLPEMVRDQIVIRHEEKNRVYYQLTEKGQMLALALENPETLADLYEEEETKRVVGVEAPLLFDFLRNIRSLRNREVEIFVLVGSGVATPSEWSKRIADIRNEENKLAKRFERTKDKLQEEMGLVSIPHIARFTGLESLEDLARQESYRDEEEFAEDIESLLNKFSSLKQRKERLKLAIKGLEKLREQKLLDENEYIERKSTYERKLRAVEGFLSKVRELI